MPSVDSDPIVKTFNGKELHLHSYWESWYGGSASVHISLYDPKNDKFRMLWGKNVKEWKDGNFTDDDVKKKYGKKFNEIYKKLKKKAKSHQIKHIRTSKKGRKFIAGRKKVRDYKYYKWIAAVLANDEISTNEELLRLFMEGGPMSREEAKFYIDQRERFNVFGYELVKWDKKSKLYERLGGKTVDIEVGGEKVEFVDKTVWEANICRDCGHPDYAHNLKRNFCFNCISNQKIRNNCKKFVGGSQK